MIKPVICISLFIALISCSETPSKKPDQSMNTMIDLEKKLQNSNVMLVARGNDSYYTIKEEIAYIKSTSDLSEASENLEIILQHMDKINKFSEHMISYIDQLKIELLEKSGENLQKYKDQDPNTILWRRSNKKNYNFPIVLNLNAIERKRDIGIVNLVLTGNAPMHPSDRGLQLWEMLNHYRLELVKATGTYTIRDNSFSIAPENINEFKNDQELKTLVTKMIDSQKNANLKEDRQVLIDLYTMLTKKEFVVHTDNEKAHWIYATFHNANIVSAISELTALQYDILSARALALMSYEAKISICR